MKADISPRRLMRLFTSMLTISAFTFGGGFVIISLMKKRFVDELRYLTQEEMLDMTALAQSAPGPIAINAAILVGRHAAGLPGMLAAVTGTLIPPVIIIGVISLIYNTFLGNPWVQAALRGMSCGVAAVIADVVCSLGGKVLGSRDAVRIALMVLAFVLTFCLRVDVIFILLGAIGVGVVRTLFTAKEAA